MEGDAFERGVEADAERAFGVVDAERDRRPGKARIGHAGQGEEQATGEGVGCGGGGAHAA